MDSKSNSSAAYSFCGVLCCIICSLPVTWILLKQFAILPADETNVSIHQLVHHPQQSHNKSEIDQNSSAIANQSRLLTHITTPTNPNTSNISIENDDNLTIKSHDQLILLNKTFNDGNSTINRTGSEIGVPALIIGGGVNCGTTSLKTMVLMINLQRYHTGAHSEYYYWTHCIPYQIHIIEYNQTMVEYYVNTTLDLLHRLSTSPNIPNIPNIHNTTSPNANHSNMNEKKNNIDININITIDDSYEIAHSAIQALGLMKWDTDYAIANITQQEEKQKQVFYGPQKTNTNPVLRKCTVSDYLEEYQDYSKNKNKHKNTDDDYYYIEKTPSYLTTTHASVIFSKYLSKTKFMFILRNPISRLWSFIDHDDKGFYWRKTWTNRSNSTMVKITRQASVEKRLWQDLKNEKFLFLHKIIVLIENYKKQRFGNCLNNDNSNNDDCLNFVINYEFVIYRALINMIYYGSVEPLIMLNQCYFATILCYTFAYEKFNINRFDNFKIMQAEWFFNDTNTIFVIQHFIEQNGITVKNFDYASQQNLKDIIYANKNNSQISTIKKHSRLNHWNHLKFKFKDLNVTLQNTIRDKLDICNAKLEQVVHVYPQIQLGVWNFDLWHRQEA